MPTMSVRLVITSSRAPMEMEFGAYMFCVRPGRAFIKHSQRPVPIHRLPEWYVPSSCARALGEGAAWLQSFALARMQARSASIWFGVKHALPRQAWRAAIDQGSDEAAVLVHVPRVPVLEIVGAEADSARGVKGTPATGFEDLEAYPPQGLVEYDLRRAGRRMPGAQEVVLVADAEGAEP